MSDEKKMGNETAKLSEAEAEKVSGGFVETSGYAVSHEIVCPNCGNALADHFDSWIEEGDGERDHYRCTLCGNEFVVDAYGYYAKN